MTSVFKATDCQLFARYPNGVRWDEVSDLDKLHFKEIRERLKALAEETAAKNVNGLPFQHATSLHTPNGRSAKDIWCCVFPKTVPNKSFGLQAALIISQRGCEVCFCLGAGTSQEKDPQRLIELEQALVNAREKLRTVPREVIAAVEQRTNRKWFFRRSWRDEPNKSDFLTLTEWLGHASSSGGSKSSVSVYFSPEQLQEQGPGIAAVLEDALRTFMPIFLHVYSSTPNELHGLQSSKSNTEPEMPTLALNTSMIDQAVKDMGDAGLRVERNFLSRFVSSLSAKPFLILTGSSGTGKTKLAQAVAQWLGTSADHVLVVPVGADWTGNENILGYPNGLEKTAYVTKPALDLVLRASANPELPHFLILDEMNLSHVERYFADILSAIESDEKIHLHRDAERKANGTAVPPEVKLPKNLFIIGTVNVDETTYMFSPKVLDRANVIEFRTQADELRSFLDGPKKPDLSKLSGRGAGFGKALAYAAKSPSDVPAGAKDAFEKEMILYFNVMQLHGAEFGYRVAYEAGRFVHFYNLLGRRPVDGPWFSRAFDCVVVQKFLPKLHGSRAKLGPLLKELWFLCVNDAAGRGVDALKAAEKSKAEPLKDLPANAPYPLSAEKIYRMWRLMMDNGFASFAEA